MLFGSPLWIGVACGLILLDLLRPLFAVRIGGGEPGVLALVVRRCVLGLFARTCGFFGLVVVVTAGAFCGASAPSAPSVSSFSPSVVGSGPPLTMISIAFLIF